MCITRSLKWISGEFEIHIHFSGPIDVEGEHFVFLIRPAAGPIVVKEENPKETTGGLKSHERLQLM